MERIFIDLYGYNLDWIMGKIANDIQENAIKLGYKCRMGRSEDYEGEEICYHLSYHIAVPNPSAKHNSVFYTHLNDVLQERNLVSIKDKFDSFICMSPEDAQYLIDLGFESNKVYGRTLPIRNNYIKPISVGIFSACYIDGRKNEEWLLEFCEKNKQANLVNFVFIGQGWGEVVRTLEKLDCSYEWHNVSRTLPFEYQFQQNKLASLNYYIYMGMDGGAMGTYDAYAQDIPLCVTFDGFHKSVPDIDHTFDNKDSFMKQMNYIISKHSRRVEFFKTFTSENYVKWIINVWNGEKASQISDDDRKCISYNSVVEKKRDQYYSLNFNRIKDHLMKQIKKYVSRNKYNIKK